jgi:hypothetical protein
LTVMEITMDAQEAGCTKDLHMYPNLESWKKLNTKPINRKKVFAMTVKMLQISQSTWKISDTLSMIEEQMNSLENLFCNNHYQLECTLLVWWEHISREWWLMISCIAVMEIEKSITGCFW